MVRLCCAADSSPPACRVTAHGIFLPLQVFLHQNPDGSPSSVGWGVRCAVGIPAGTFVCAHSGVVATRAETRPGSRHVLPLDGFLNMGAALSEREHDLSQVWLLG